MVKSTIYPVDPIDLNVERSILIKLTCDCIWTVGIINDSGCQHGVSNFKCNFSTKIGNIWFVIIKICILKITKFYRKVLIFQFNEISWNWAPKRNPSLIVCHVEWCPPLPGSTPPQTYGSNEGLMMMWMMMMKMMIILHLCQLI